MKIIHLEKILNRLSTGGIKYLIAGGLAVVAHGYNRLTMDLDLIIALDEENVSRAIQVFEELDFQPMVPVRFEEFSNPENRDIWHNEKNMIAFSISSPQFPNLIVDLFTQVPFNFNSEYERAHWDKITDTTRVPFISKSTLINLKKESNRLKDQLDMEHLI